VGEVTDVNGWDEALSMQEMIDWTTCTKMREGNMVK